VVVDDLRDFNPVVHRRAVGWNGLRVLLVGAFLNAAS